MDQNPPEERDGNLRNGADTPSADKSASSMATGKDLTIKPSEIKDAGAADALAKTSSETATAEPARPDQSSPKDEPAAQDTKSDTPKMDPGEAKAVDPTDGAGGAERKPDETAEAAAVSEAVARKSWPRRLARGFSYGVLGVCTLLACLVGYLYYSGPVSVPFLAKWLSEHASIGPAQISIANASFDLAADGGIQVVVDDAHLLVKGDVPVEVILPRLEAPIDGMALLKGSLNFASLDLDRPVVILGVPDGGEKNLPPMAGLMEAVSRVADVVDLQFSKRKLAVLRISNGAFRTEGAMARSFNGIDASLTRDETGRLVGRARVAGRFGPWDMRFDRVPGQDAVGDSPAKGSELGIKFRDITIGDLLDPAKDIEHGKGMGLPVSAEFLAQFDDKGRFEQAGAVGRVLNGWFRLGRTSVRFDDVALELAWHRDLPVIRVKPSHVIRGNTQISFSGAITPPENGQTVWKMDLISDYPQFGSSDIPLDPVMLDQIAVNGRFDMSTKTAYLDQAVFTAGPAKVRAAATVDILSDGPYLALALDGENLPVDMVKQVWPITLVPPARSWMIDHLHEGKINHITYTAAVRPPAFNSKDPDPGWSGNDMLVDMSFQDVRLSPVGEVPDIQNLSGTLDVSNEVLTVTAKNGFIGGATGQPSERVDVPEGTFKILNLPLRHGKVGVLDVSLAGPAGPLGEIFNAKPFEVLEKANLQSSGVTGSSTVSLQAQFPMEDEIDLADVKWSAKAHSNDFTSPHPVEGHKISKADIELSADPSHVAITGKGLLDGLQADIDLIIPLNGSKVQGRQGVALTADAQQLKARGIDLTSLIDGTMELNLQEQPDGSKRFDIDLTSARLRLAPLGWGKASGVQASAGFVMEETGNEIRIKNFRLTSEGVDVAGSLRLGNDGTLVAADFQKFHLRSGDKAALSIAGRGRDSYDVRLSGSSFDARGFLQQLKAPTSDGDSRDDIANLDLEMDLDRVTGFRGRVEDFAGKVKVDKSGIRQADLSGQVNGRAPFSFRITPVEGGGRTAHGEFSDVGATLRFLDLYERMRGGRGELDVAMPGETDWTGRFLTRDLSITEDPALKKLSAENQSGNPVGNSGELVQPTANGTGGDASFNKLELDFVRSGEQLRIIRGALEGAVFGGTVTGDVNLANSSLNLSGTFVPIYALNNIFSKIPVLGFALGGNSQEGLLGVTYRVTGALSDPVLTVNPLSFIAPGIFRKMFEFQQ